MGASNAEELWNAALSYVRRNEITDVFLVAYWSDYEEQAEASELIASIEHTASRFKTAGAQTWVLMDAPTYNVDVVKSVVRKILFPEFSPLPASTMESEHRQKNSAMYKLSASRAEIRFLDPSPLLLDVTTNRYFVIDKGFPYYSDSHHMTSWGVDRAISPLIEGVFNELSRTSTSGH